MMTATLVNNELSLERVQIAVEAILSKLGEPQTESQKKALEAFHRSDHATVKRLSSLNLSDPFIKSLGYLGSAAKLTPNTDTILSESARAAADWAREKTLSELSSALENALGGVD
jgi:hypothetical protein